MDVLENYEYLMLEKERLLKRKEDLEKQIRNLDEIIYDIDQASDLFSKTLIYMDINSFINYLALFSGIQKDDIKIKFDLNGNELNFHIYSVSDVCKFYYDLDFPLSYDMIQVLGKRLKDSIWLSSFNDLECQYSIFNEDDLVCSVTLGDLENFSDGKENHPKDLFKKAIIPSMVDKKCDKQKKL